MHAYPQERFQEAVETAETFLRAFEAEQVKRESQSYIAVHSDRSQVVSKLVSCSQRLPTMYLQCPYTYSL